jgi:hypothetical protein
MPMPAPSGLDVVRNPEVSRKGDAVAGKPRRPIEQTLGVAGTRVRSLEFERTREQFDRITVPLDKYSYLMDLQVLISSRCLPLMPLMPDASSCREGGLSKDTGMGRILACTLGVAAPH